MGITRHCQSECILLRSVHSNAQAAQAVPACLPSRLSWFVACGLQGPECVGWCGGAGQKGGLLSREAVQEALAACSLVTVLVQLMSDAALQPLEPTFRSGPTSTPASSCQRCKRLCPFLDMRTQLDGCVWKLHA